MGAVEGAERCGGIQRSPLSNEIAVGHNEVGRDNRPLTASNEMSEA